MGKRLVTVDLCVWSILLYNCRFEKGRESSTMQPFYDQGEKMRVPAWTDRVFFRASAPQRAALAPNPTDTPADIRVSCTAGWARGGG